MTRHLPLLIRQIAAQPTESQRIPTDDARTCRCECLDIDGLRVGTIRLILSDFVGQHRRRSDTPWQNPTGWTRSPDGPFSRASPAPPASCRSPRSWPPAAPRQRRPRRARRRRHVGRQRAGRLVRRERRHGLRHVRFELFEQGHRHEGHAGRRRCVHGQDRDRGQGQHGRPQHVPGPDQHLPAGHAGRHVHLVRRLPDAVLRRSGPGHGHQRPLDQDRLNYSDAFKASSTGNDGKQYFIPFYNYPWVVIYRKSVFAERATPSPRRSTSSRPSATR